MTERAGWRRWPWAILALALGVRLALLLWSGSYHPFGDPFDYDQLGQSLAEEGRYRATLFAEPGTASAFRPPAYPYWVAAVYSVFGTPSYDAVRIAGALLGTLVVLLVWLLGRRVVGERAAWWAALAAALVPSLAWIHAGLLSETLYLPLVLAAVLLVVRLAETPSWRWAAGAGVVLGASVMTRTNGLVVVLPLLAGAWAARRSWRDCAVLLAGFALALAPWTIRNAVVFGEFLPLGTQPGITAVGVYNDEAAQGTFYGVWRGPEKIGAFTPLLAQPGTTEADLDARFRAEALRYARTHPGYTARVFARHLLQLLELRDVSLLATSGFAEAGIPEGLARRSTHGGFLVLLALAAAGAVLLVRRHTLRPLWLWSVPVLLLLSMAPFQGIARYRLPVDPFLCLLAGVAITTALARLDRRSDRMPGWLPGRTTAGDGSSPPSPSPR